MAKARHRHRYRYHVDDHESSKKSKEMKNKGLVDVEDGVDGVQKFDLDGDGLLRRALAGCG